MRTYILTAHDRAKSYLPYRTELVLAKTEHGAKLKMRRGEWNDVPWNHIEVYEKDREFTNVNY